MTKNKKLTENWVLILLSNFSRHHWSLESAAKMTSDCTIYHQVLCLLLYFFLLSENVTTLVPHNLLFCIKPNTIVFLSQKIQNILK